jgi:LacI family transcriptional regulator
VSAAHGTSPVTVPAGFENILIDDVVICRYTLIDNVVILEAHKISSMVSIKEVAKKAGVSVKTVSRVINNESGVRESTRQRVLRSVEELGYLPHAGARNMRTKRSQTIGLITDEIATTPFAVNIIRGAQDLAWAHNKLLLIANTDGDKQKEDLAIRMMLERRVEGIIYATWFHRAVEVPDSIREQPLVLVDCYSEDGLLTSVVPDEIQGGRDATEALIGKGHQRIGFINLTSGTPAALGRLQGYREAIDAHGIPFDPTLVRNNESGQADEGYEQARILMSQPNPPSALFCGNDRTAMGAYQALKELGFHIPQDVAVIGVDNQEVIAAYLRPSLSTMALPHYAMGQWAVQYLLEHTKGLVKQEKLKCSYIARESV